MLDEYTTTTSRLQEIAEDSRQALGRPVAIDDRHHRLLVYTEHPDDEVDPVRLASILRQPPSPQLIEWLTRHDVRTASGPVRVPANESLGLEARVCVPIRCEAHLLGFFWLTDRDESMGEDELDVAGNAADEAGIVLYRDMILRDLERGREREFMRDVLSQKEETRASAMEQLEEFELFVAEGPVVVLAVHVLGDHDAVSPEAMRLSLDAALMRVRRQVSPKHCVHLLRADHAVILVSLSDPWIRSHGRIEFGQRVHDEVMENVSERGDLRCVVALGGESPNLDHAWISHGQAARAYEVSQTVASFGEVVDWEHLGVYRFLAELPLDRLGPEVIHPALNQLMDDERAHSLIYTVERYLDNACDVQSTAGDLFLHRTSLYHRLRRFEEAAGVDLASGADRLTLHLSLKLARLQGRAWEPPEAGERATRGSAVAPSSER